MKKNYIQPSIEAMTVNAISNLCANSSSESLGIVNPNDVDPGNVINAESGR